MKVAVAYQDGEIYGHFGHCPMFAVYEYGEYVSDCTKKLVDSSDRAGHQQMADLMKELNVDAVIVGNMGGAFVGLLILNTFQIGMGIVGVNPFWVNVFSGILLLVALSFDFFAMLRQKKSLAH